jgi:hypothetical protein
VPIGKGGFQPLEASSKSGNVLGRLGQLAMGMNRAKQNIEIFNYQQDRKDEGMLKRYAAESAVKTMDRNKEFELADKHIKTHGSDFVDDPRTGKRRRVTRKNVTAGRYSTGESDAAKSYGDQLIENTKLKQQITADKLEAAKLRAEERKNSGGKTKKTAAKKTSAGKPRAKKAASKSPGKGLATTGPRDNSRTTFDTADNDRLERFGTKADGDAQKAKNAAAKAKKSTVKKTAAAPKSPGTPTNPALTKMKNSGKVVF